MAIRPQNSALALVLLAAVARAEAPSHAPPTDAAPSDAQLDALLAHNPQTGRAVDGIAELLPLLSDELRQNFTFVYASRSPFKDSITPDHPRVILFSDDGSFIATFIGDAGRPGHDILETMRFDRSTARFALRARVLPAAAREGVDAVALNASCARCHGQDARPIFDSYPLWPGFYGSIEDSFPPRLPASQKEHAQYLHFLHGEAQRGVYRLLRYIKGSPVTPYADPRTFDIEDARNDAATLRYQPNSRLGMALTELNRQRIYRKLSAGDGFADRAPQYLALLLRCDGKRPRASDRAAIRTAAQKENAARLLRIGRDRVLPRMRQFQMQELDEIDNLTAIDRLATRAGVDRADWSMALEPGALSFYDGILSGMSGGHSYYLVEDLLFELLRDLSERDPRYAGYFRALPSFTTLGYPFGNKLDLARAKKSCQLSAAR